MKVYEARLEALKLAHAHGRDTPQVIERAQAYTDFIVSGVPRKPSDDKADNPE